MKILILMLFLTVSTLWAQAPKSPSNGFSKENQRLQIENIEKMRALTLKQINLNYDRMIAHQKDISKLIEKNPGDPANEVAIKSKNEAFDTEMKKRQGEFDALMKSESEKFQKMMSARRPPGAPKQ